ncbi:MAG: 5'/3'-nucleotidase SurE [Methanoregulaceae archaeon]|jgi:5'-nucleotidase|nr:5'/3'-nucleotidase SurE [Methanoregulaceae archaeon]
MKPTILLTNDDGVNSAGLWAAYEALAPIAEVTVVAPATQQSAVGRSISIFEPIRANAIVLNGLKAYAVGGKPTDSVIIGLYALSLDPALVVSGINIGENLSFESIMTSGTVGAALEAANQGTPSIAFSLQVEDQGDKFDDPRYHCQSFEDAKTVVREVCTTFLSRKFPPGADVINVNIPSHLTGRYEVTRLSRKLFLTGVEKRLDPRGRPYFWINGPLVGDDEEGTDVHAIRKGNVSLTPITLDCTAPEANSELGSLFSAPYRDFSGCTREVP